MNQSIANNLPEDQIQREIEKLEKNNKKQEQRVRNLETKSLQVLNLYFVFQGVIFTSVSNSSSLRCHNWWMPFSLSLLAATLNLYALVVNVSKILKSKEEIDQAKADLGLVRLYGMTKAQISQVLPGTRLNQPGMEKVTEVFRPKPDLAWMWRRWVAAGLAIGLFMGFSGAVMYGCYIILCHSNNNSGCVKLC